MPLNTLSKGLATGTTLNTIVEQLIDHAINFGIKVIAVIIVFIIGRWLIKWILKLIDKFLANRQIDSTVKSFLDSLTNITLKTVLFLVIVNILGISMTSFAAILAAAGLAIGMAMKDNLSNFAGGVMLLINRPFKVGDRIEAQGMDGTVNSIGILYTVLITGDNRTIFIPNGPLSTGSITNFSNQPQRRIDLSLILHHGVDIENTKTILWNLINTNSLIKQNPAPFIGVTALNNLSLTLTLRLWTDSADYSKVNVELNEQIYVTLKEKNIFMSVEPENIEYSNN